MRYFVIEPIEGLTSIERANLISEQLFELSKPKTERQKGDVTSMLFWVINNGTDAVLCADGDYQIKVHPNHDIRVLKILYPNISAQEREGLVNYIRSVKSFPFKNIIPSNSNEVDYQYLIDNGFIQDDII